MAGKSTITQEVVAQARRLIGEGRTQRQAAAELGVSQSGLSVRLAASADEPHDPTEGYEEIPVIVRDYSHLDKLRVYPIGDLHVGSPAHDGKKLDEWLAFVERSPNASMLNTGDNINAAVVGSKSDVYAEQMTVGDALERLEDKLRPLADAGRLDALGEGNHEARVQRATGIDPMALVARHLGVDHWAASALVVYHVGDVEYRVHVRHGTGNSPASTAAVTKAAQVVSNADLHVTGHTHRQQLILEDVFAYEKGRVERRSRRYVTSGSFTKYERYAAERGYAPSHLGAPRIVLSGRRHDVHVSV